jgi:hypothetical protein
MGVGCGDSSCSDNDTSGMNEGSSSRSGGSCFPKSAGVLTVCGYKSIADIAPGDLVLSWSAGSLYQKPVTKVVRHAPAQIYDVKFLSGRILRVTRTHTMLASTGWRVAHRLRHGDSLMSVGGPPEIISSIKPNPKPEVVFNLVTADEHNFIVDGLIAHNFTFLRRTRVGLHRLMIDWRWKQKNLSPQQRSGRPALAAVEGLPVK